MPLLSRRFGMGLGIKSEEASKRTSSYRLASPICSSRDHECFPLVIKVQKVGGSTQGLESEFDFLGSSSAMFRRNLVCLHA